MSDSVGRGEGSAGPGPKTQDGIVIGNVEDKENLSNPIARRMVRGFDRALDALVAEVAAAAPLSSIHEVGCGEGRLTRRLAERFPGVPIRATDFARDLIRSAREEASERGPESLTYEVRSIYDLDPAEDAADLVLCCEVLEHVDEADRAVEALRRLDARSYVLSVPREPLWRVLNVCRGKYLSDFGNTPGHLNHWSQRGFRRFLAAHGFRVRRLRAPLPWTMVEGAFEGS